ncbi:MAG TPA: hypothetical protein VIQ03_11235 [Gammaproteobacteria bacterium]
MTKSSVLLLSFAMLLVNASAYAVVNPFKKTKDYAFNDDVNWYFKEGAAVKSGSRREDAEVFYYHLNINKERMRLRLSKNDPSGELENTRDISDLEIEDVLVDGRRLARFQWCLDNQERIGKTLKSDAVVINDTCIVSGNDFSIFLNDETKSLLKRAGKIDFVITPYGRPIRLSYSMGGFAGVMAQVDRPEPPPVINRPAPVKPVVAPKPVKKVVKTCYANPPAEFNTVIKPEDYPCDDMTRKAAAVKAVDVMVEKERQKRREAEAARLRKEAEQAEARKIAEEKSKIEKEWEAKQEAIWVTRCQKHWVKGESPCYCEKYLDSAPKGVKNTCGQ